MRAKSKEITVVSHYPEDMEAYYELLAEASARALLVSLTEEEIAAILDDSGSEE